MATTTNQLDASAPAADSGAAKRAAWGYPHWLTLLPYAGAIVFLYLLTRPVLRDWWVRYTAPESYYAHAPLIPLICALMLWSRREALWNVPKAPCLWALAGLVPALSLYVFAGQNYALALMSASLPLIVWSGVWLALGTRFVRAFWAPLAFLALMVPLPGPLLNDATVRLQMASTAFADRLLRLMSFHTVLQGNVIQMDDYLLWVDVPCSGLKTLLSLLTFSAAFALLVDGTRTRRLTLFLVSIPLALLINSVRVTLIGVVGECIGAPAAHIFHDWSGILTLVLGFAALFSLAKALGCKTFAGWTIF